MRMLPALMALLIALFWAAPIRSDDKGTKDSDVAKALSKIVELGPGVHKIKTDSKGRIQSCVVVGQSRISTVLGKAKGLETARDRARLAASAEYSKWIKENVSIHEKTEDEVVLFLEGSEDNDKDALRESGKAIEKTSKKIESVSQALIRGLQILHVDVSEKDKTYTVVMGWSTANVRAAKDAEQKNEGSDKGGDSKNSGASKKKPDKKIGDKKATSDDIKKFLGDK